MLEVIEELDALQEHFRAKHVVQLGADDFTLSEPFIIIDYRPLTMQALAEKIAKTQVRIYQYVSGYYFIEYKRGTFCLSEKPNTLNFKRAVRVCNALLSTSRTL